MNVTSSYYAQDIYYYADNYNYTEEYLQEIGFNREITTLVGIGYCLFAGISLLFYLRLMIIIIKDKKLNKLSAYQIILHNGFADSLNLLLWIIGGLSTITLSTFNGTFAKIAGALFEFGIYSSSSLALLLAINRFVQNVFEQRIEQFFSRRLTKIYIAICWLTSLPIPILTLTPFIIFKFVPYWANNGYSTPYNNRRNLVIAIDSYSQLVKIIISTIFYFITIAYIIFQRQSVSKVEIRLTIQTMIDSLFRLTRYIVLQFFWSFSGTTVVGAIITAWLQLISNALNVYVYMIFNKSLRKQFIPKLIRKIVGKHASYAKNTVKPNTNNNAISSLPPTND